METQIDSVTKQLTSGNEPDPTYPRIDSLIEINPKFKRRLYEGPLQVEESKSFPMQLLGLPLTGHYGQGELPSELRSVEKPQSRPPAQQKFTLKRSLLESHPKPASTEKATLTGPGVLSILLLTNIDYPLFRIFTLF